MKQIIDFPRISFAQLPTPLYKLENLSLEIGKNIYIKRDDMTGVALGGNRSVSWSFFWQMPGARGRMSSSPPVVPSLTTLCSPPPVPDSWV